MSPHTANLSIKSDSDLVVLIIFNSEFVLKTTTILRNNLWGDPCYNIPADHDNILHLYCQNVNGIFDTDNIGLNDAFHTMRTLGADIFTFNKTPSNDVNPKLKMAVHRSE